MTRDKRKETEDLFDKVADGWGQHGPNYWQRFGKRLIDMTHIKSSDKVLDLAMGRGASLFPACKIVKSSGEVHGIDLSSKMVALVNKDMESLNINNLVVHKMDVDQLNFKDGYFDVVTAGFIFGHFVHSEKKFKELQRVLTEEGIFSFSTWGIQKDQEWLHKIVATYLPPPKKTPEVTPSNDPKIATNTVDGVRQIVSQSGFTNIQVIEESSEIIYKSKDDYWKDMWSNGARRIFEQIEVKGQDTLQDFKDDLYKGLDSFSDPRGYVLKMNIIYCQCCFVSK